MSTRLLTQLSRFLVGTVMLATVVLGVAKPNVVHASISNTRQDAWGTLELSGSDPNNLAGQGVNVYSNGATATGPSPDVYNCITIANGGGTLGCPSGTVPSGIKWQCVELVNRLYLTKGWISSRWPGFGNQMYGNAGQMGLTAVPNGSITSISPGDSIFMDDGHMGHAAYISAVNGSNVTIVSQNTQQVFLTSTLSNGTLSTPLTGYTVQGIVKSPGDAAPTSGPLYQFVNSGSGWNSYNITYTGGGKTYNIQGTPSVLWGSTVNVFGVGPDGQLLQYSLPSGGSWFPYTLSANNMLAGGVSAVQVGSTIEVFATGTNGHLYQFVNSGSGWNWYDITYSSGGTWYTVQGSPSVVWGSTVNVYAAGTNGELLQYSLPSGGSWFPYTLSANNTVTGGVSALQVGSTLIDFATATGGRLYQFVNSGSGWNWYDITYGAYTVQGGPSAIWGSTVNVFTIGNNAASGNVLQYSLPSGGSWFPWTINSPTALAGGMSAVMVGSTFQVFGD